MRYGENVGEPGGGPFLAYNSDGTISLQILESSQIDMDDPEKKEMFEKGTHFNPVDLVCAVRDYKGHKFNLVNFVDKATGFISYKSKNGKDLKALELPGSVERCHERLEYGVCRSFSEYVQSVKDGE